ncbi:MAG: glycosyltransferase family 39 protein [Armatimonadetes bacterium]|nr:glycosyltransferase family 39 protein [Armatimonadota bacterium]
MAVRSGRPRRAAARGFEGFARIERFCKTAAVTALILVIGIGCFGRFFAARFGYLENPIAIEQAEIARNLRSGDGFTTSVGYLPILNLKADNGGWVAGGYHPLYPIVLSGFFRLRGASDRGVALLNGLVHLATGLLVYLLALQLRGQKTAVLAVLLYYISLEAIGTALSATGLTLASFFLSLSVLLALKCRAAQDPSSPTRARSVRVLAGLTGASAACAYLSGGLSLLLAIPLAWLATGVRAWRRETWALVCGAFALVIAPWVVRNIMVSGTVAPVLAQYQLIAGTPSFPGSSVLTTLPSELPEPISWALTHPGEMAAKLFSGAVSSYRNVPSFMNLYLFPFLVMFGLGAAARQTRHAVWIAFLVMGCVQLFTALVYNVTPDLIELDVFLPLGLCFASCAVAAVITERIPKPTWRFAAVLGLMILTGFPYATSLLGGRNPAYAAWSMSPLGLYLAKDAVIATDAPAPAAWYSGRRAVMLPPDPNDLPKLKQYGVDPDYVFLTGGAAGDPRNPWAQLAFASSRGDAKAQKIIGKRISYSINLGDVSIYQRRDKKAKGVTVGPKKESPDDRGSASQSGSGKPSRP